MTPANTGSRTALLTWAVTATILGSAALIWAVVSFVQNNTSTKNLDSLKVRYAEIVDAGSLSGEEVAKLKEAKKLLQLPASTSILNVAIKQRDDLTKLVAGESVNDIQAAGRAAAAMAAAGEAVGPTGSVSNVTLIAAVEDLTKTVATAKKSTADKDAQIAALNKKLTDAQTAMAAYNQAADGKVDDAQARALTSQQDADAYRKSQDDQLATVQDNWNKTKAEADSSANAAVDVQNRVARELSTVRAERDRLVEQLKLFRLPTDQIVRHADGQILRLSGADRLTINLGAGDQISAGMTFEIFDRFGVPRVASDAPENDKLLQGKASIEVVRVLPGSSECRIVRRSPGMTPITEGDPIVNVVYDRNAKYDFFVFGKFNLDYKGEPSERDTEVVKRLISQWGADVAAKINTETDFVVLGVEPTVPNYSQAELDGDQLKGYEMEKATQELEAFNEVRLKAQALNIPILNQTRFLYLVGYYEEAGR